MKTVDRIFDITLFLSEIEKARSFLYIENPSSGTGHDEREVPNHMKKELPCRRMMIPIARRASGAGGTIPPKDRP